MSVTDVAAMLYSLGQVSPNDFGWAERAGVIGLLALAVTAFVRGWIHTDKEFQAVKQELTEDRDFWREAATRGTSAAENATQATLRATGADSIEELARKVRDIL